MVPVVDSYVNAKMRPKSTAYSCIVPLGNPKRRCLIRVTPKTVSKRDPQVGFVIQALSEALLGGSFG